MEEMPKPSGSYSLSEMLLENICFVLNCAGARPISDQSGHLFPDWLGDSILPVNQVCETLNGRERRWHYLGRLVLKQLGISSIITVLPLSGGRVDDAKQLVIGHGLGVEVRPHRASLHVLIGPLQ